MNTAWELFTRADRIRELSEALIVWSAKGAIVLALAGAIAWLLRKSTARVRHLAWALAVVGVLLLPGVEGLIPGWSIQGLLPVTVEPERPTVVVEPTPIPIVKNQDCTGTPTALGEGRLPPPSSAVTVGTGPSTLGAPTSPGGSPGFGPLEERGPTLLFAIWLLGLVAFAIRPLVGVFRRRRLLRDARSASPPARELLERLRSELGISRPVRLVRIPEAVIPMTWGTVRPVIVLPAGSEQWPRARLRHVLLHELAHVARFDACLFAVARFLCVVQWFDPLAWYAARRLRAEAELACDDRVLLADDRAALYAGHLLESLREARGVTPAGAIAMARRSLLGSRIEAILEPGRRLRPSRRTLLAAAAMTVAVLIPLSALTLSEPPDPPELPEAPPDPEWTWSATEPPPEADLSVPAVQRPEEEAANLPGPSLTGALVVSVPESPALPAPTAPRVANPGMPRTDLATVQLPSPPDPPVVPSTALGSGASHSLSVHESDDGRGGFFDHPEYEEICRGGWLGIGDRRYTRRVRSDDDEWSIELHHAGCSLEIELQGDVRFEVLDGGIQSLGRRARVRIEEETDAGNRLLRATAGPDDEPRYDYQVDGREAPVDRSVRSWLERVTTEIFRTTGYQAEERASAILRHRGVEGVLAETERISSDHVHRLYATRLLVETELSDGHLRRLLGQAADRIGSDHEMGALLVDALPRIDSPSDEKSFLEAAETVGSDHEARRILEALAETRSLGSESLRLFLGVARSIGSDFEMAEALLTLLDEWPRGESLPAELFRALDTIGSDFEARRVLQAVPTDRLGTAGWTALFDAARGIGSDFEMAELLIDLAQEGPEPLPPAFFQAFSSVGSDREARRVLQTVVVERNLAPGELVRVLKASRSIGSDHELSELLISVGRRYALEGPVREAFLDASRGIGSSRERGRVLLVAHGG